MNITEASKILAEYDGLVYIPFNDLQGFSKAGYWQVLDNSPVIWKFANPDGTTKEVEMKPFVNPKGGWIEVGDNDVRAKYVCRNHSQLRYFNDYNELFRIIAKLEKEDLKEYCYKWRDGDETRYNFAGLFVDKFTGVWDIYIALDLDQPLTISNSEKHKHLPDREQLFWNLVDAVKYINELKNG